MCHNDAVELSEGHPGMMFVELVDCGHVIEVKKLDQWMNKSDGGRGENKEVEIKLKRCPKCSFPMFCSPCNGSIVKNVLTDFEAVKRRVFLSEVANNVQIQKIRNKLQKLKNMGMEMAKTIEKSISSSSVTSEQLNKHQNQVVFLTFLGNLVTKYKNVMEANDELDSRINLLMSRIMTERVCFSEQEIKELIEELSRTKLLVGMKHLMTTLEDTKSMDTVRSALESVGKQITRLIIMYKKIDSSDWLRAVQFKCNTSTKA